MGKKPIALACAALLTTAGFGQNAGKQDLQGLWVAKAHFGPDVRGTLTIRSRGAGLVGEIAGISVPVEQRGKAISFELPDGKGNFRGTRLGTTIEGHWIQSVTRSSGARYATPIVLNADSRGVWQGEVVPMDDRMTYYLPVVRSNGGRLSSYLRNPERNQGIFLGVSRVEQEGDVIRLVGTQRGQKEERLIASGKRDSGSGNFAVPIQGMVYNFVRDAESSSDFYPRGKAPGRYKYLPPLQLDDGWPVSTPEKEGIDRAAIERFVQKLVDMPMDGISSSQIHSVAIARHGKLVLEEYFHGHHRDMPHDTRSAAKSWTNVLIGAAMQAGVPIRLDTPVYRTMLGQVPADLDPRKRAMTLEHLISMTAGFDCDDSGDRPGDEDVYQDQRQEPNWYRFMLNVPMAWNSGDQIVYCSGKPNLAAGMLEKIAQEPMPELFYRLVAKPMRMRNYHLFLQPTGEAYGGGGHHFTTRDFMKLTQLFLNDGKWEDKQIVSREWARKSSAPLRNLSPRQTYGYLWNSVAYDYKGRKLHAFFPGGNGGQVYIGIPDLGLLIAFTGGNYADSVLFRAQREFVPQDILPAVK